MALGFPLGPRRSVGWVHLQTLSADKVARTGDGSRQPPQELLKRPFGRPLQPVGVGNDEENAELSSPFVETASRTPEHIGGTPWNLA
jgi:hypothetical protein